MTPRGLAILASATLLAVLAAGWSVVAQLRGTAQAALDTPLLPGLLERINNVARLEITSAAGPLTVERAGDGWRLVERGGYPVDAAAVADLVVRLADLRLVEAKTADAQRLPRLELEDPTARNAKSYGIRMLDAAGSELGAAVVGKKAYGLFGPGRSGSYVRRASEDQAWLAAGEIEVPGKAVDWIERQILDIPAAQVTRVDLEPPDDAGPLTIERDGDGFVLSPLPDGREPDQDRLARTAGVLESLVMQDVRPAAEVDLSQAPGRARFALADGRSVTVTWVADGVESWARFEVAATAAEASESAKAAALAPRLDGWVYRLSEFITARLRGQIEPLLVPAAAG